MSIVWKLFSSVFPIIVALFMASIKLLNRRREICANNKLHISTHSVFDTFIFYTSVIFHEAVDAYRFLSASPYLEPHPSIVIMQKSCSNIQVVQQNSCITRNFLLLICFSIMPIFVCLRYCGFIFRELIQLKIQKIHVCQINFRFVYSVYLNFQKHL